MDPLKNVVGDFTRSGPTTAAQRRSTDRVFGRDAVIGKLVEGCVPIPEDERRSYRVRGEDANLAQLQSYREGVLESVNELNEYLSDYNDLTVREGEKMHKLATMLVGRVQMMDKEKHHDKLILQTKQ